MQKALHYKVITGNISIKNIRVRKIIIKDLFNRFSLMIKKKSMLSHNIYLYKFYRGSSDNITVVVIDLRDKKYNGTESKRNQ